MFTVKQIIKNSDNRQENSIRLWEGENIQASHNDITGQLQVTFDMSDGCHCSIDAGLVCIINSAGKTIDVFRLEGSDSM